MKFYTKNDVEFGEGGPYLKPSMQSFKGYLGVTKLLNLGEESFKDKLIRAHGEEKAGQILVASQKRGNSVHEKLETKAESMLPRVILDRLGSMACAEVFTHGQLSGVNLMGFIDALFLDSNGNYHLVDYKTKRNLYSYRRNDTWHQRQFYFGQLLCYAILAEAQYGITIETTNLIVLFSSGEEPLHISMTSEEATESRPYVDEKLQLASMS